MARIVRNRVLALLVVTSLAAGLGLAFLSHAPNRLVSGTGIALAQLLGGARSVVLIPAMMLMLAVFMPATRRSQSITAVAAALWLTGLVWLAGVGASEQAATAPALSRTSFGAGFWVQATVAALAVADALKRLPLRPWMHLLAWAVDVVQAYGECAARHRGLATWADKP